MKYLIKAGCEVDAYTCSTSDETFLPLTNVKVFPVRRTIFGAIKSTLRYIPSIRFSLADLEQTQKRIASIINHGEYDIVFVEQDKFTMSPFILKYLTKPHVYYCPQPMRSTEAILIQLSKLVCRPPLWIKILERYTAPKMDCIDKENASFAKLILTNSYFSREAILRAYGMNSFVSYLGVDTEIFRALNMERQPYVLSVGAIIPAKGFDFIIRALSLIKEEIRPSFVIVGNTVWDLWLAYLERLAVQSGVKLEIRTLITDSQLVRLYNQAKLCVYAPYLEPFGLVPLEAMACGTPVVAVKEGGIRESIIHNETGLLTERDETTFAEAIKELLVDDAKWRTISQGCVKVIQNFWTMEHAINRLLYYLKLAL